MLHQDISNCLKSIFIGIMSTGRFTPALEVQPVWVKIVYPHNDALISPTFSCADEEPKSLWNLLYYTGVDVTVFICTKLQNPEDS